MRVGSLPGSDGYDGRGLVDEEDEDFSLIIDPPCKTRRSPMVDLLGTNGALLRTLLPLLHSFDQHRSVHRTWCFAGE